MEFEVMFVAIIILFIGLIICTTMAILDTLKILKQVNSLFESPITFFQLFALRYHWVLVIWICLIVWAIVMWADILVCF
jgi:hypothetical protein